jgi:hypothetical protein
VLQEASKCCEQQGGGARGSAPEDVRADAGAGPTAQRVQQEEALQRLRLLHWRADLSGRAPADASVMASRESAWECETAGGRAGADQHIAKHGQPTLRSTQRMLCDVYACPLTQAGLTSKGV